MSNPLDKIPFPECTKHCRIIEEFGAGECENVCPDKLKDSQQTDLKPTSVPVSGREGKND